LDRVSVELVRGQGIDVEGVRIGLAPSLPATWAGACGCLASGLGRWDGADTFRVIAAWFLADVILGCIFAQLIALKQLSHVPDDPDQRVASLRLRAGIPYAAVGSPGYRLMLRVNHWLYRWGERIWPHARPHVVTAIIGTGLALVFATYLSREMLGVVAGGLLAAAVLTIGAGQDQAFLVRWLAGLHPALAWSLGYLIVAPWRVSSLGVSALFGLAAYAGAWLRHERNVGALRLLAIIWLVLIIATLVVGQPILAAMGAIAGLADCMAAGIGLGGGAVRVPFRQGKWGWLLATLLASLVIGYYGS